MRFSVLKTEEGWNQWVTEVNAEASCPNDPLVYPDEAPSKFPVLVSFSFSGNGMWGVYVDFDYLYPDSLEIIALNG